MRFPLCILASLIAAYALGYYLTIPANPEIQFWHSVVEVRDAEIAAVRKQLPDTPIIFFTGGSSTAFSIDPKIIEESTGFPCFNLGLPVATEAKYLLHQALQRSQPGDFIIVCLEHGLLISYEENQKPSKLSFALAVKAGTPGEAAGGNTFCHSVSITDYLNYSRPGALHLPTLVARKIINKPYRYNLEDLRYHGRVETPIHNPNIMAIGPSEITNISPDAHMLLTKFKKAADRKQVHVAFSLPWMYTTPEKASELRSENLLILEEISLTMPVMEDVFTGVADNLKWFSDSGLHLSAEGSKQRTTALITPLANWLKALPTH